MDKIIHRKVRLNCSQQEAFKLFTENARVETWLTEIADIEPYVGGKYELFWDRDNKSVNSTIDCKVTAIENNKLLCFEWKGPPQFARFMNSSKPLTHVSVFFVSDNDHQNMTDIHLIHTGWGSDEDWDQARMWFETVWTNALDHLKNVIRK